MEINTYYFTEPHNPAKKSPKGFPQHSKKNQPLTSPFSPILKKPLVQNGHSLIQKGHSSIGIRKIIAYCVVWKKIKSMTTLETINALQIFCLVVLGFIIFMVGWLLGAEFSRKYRC